jgi:hypothetical protein
VNHRERVARSRGCGRIGYHRLVAQ